MSDLPQGSEPAKPSSAKPTILTLADDVIQVSPEDMPQRNVTVPCQALLTRGQVWWHTHTHTHSTK